MDPLDPRGGFYRVQGLGSEALRLPPGLPVLPDSRLIVAFISGRGVGSGNLSKTEAAPMGVALFSERSHPINGKPYNEDGQRVL